VVALAPGPLRVPIAGTAQVAGGTNVALVGTATR